MVEHLLAKEGVAGSNPVFRSTLRQLVPRLDSLSFHGWENGEQAVRLTIHSEHPRLPKYPLVQSLLLKEWVLVPRGDGQSVRTVERVTLAVQAASRRVIRRADVSAAGRHALTTRGCS